MTGVFIKGCRSQLHWLCHCLQLLEKNWHTPGEFVVMLDHDCEEPIKDWRIARARYLFTEPWPDPYMHALYCKATADLYTTSDPILLMDCDTMLESGACLEDFMSENCLIVEYLNWRTDEPDVGRQVAQRLWPRIVRESTGLELDRDYMVSRPWIFWRSTFVQARKLIRKHRGLESFRQAVYSTAAYDWRNYENHPFTFCDLQTLGLVAAREEPERYVLKEKTTDSWPFADYWSNTRWTAEIENRLKKLLTP